MFSQIMESINNDYCPHAFTIRVMLDATSQWSLINTKSQYKNIITTWQMSADSSDSKN